MSIIEGLQVMLLRMSSWTQWCTQASLWSLCNFVDVMLNSVLSVQITECYSAPVDWRTAKRTRRSRFHPVSLAIHLLLVRIAIVQKSFLWFPDKERKSIEFLEQLGVENNLKTSIRMLRDSSAEEKADRPENFHKSVSRYWMLRRFANKRVTSSMRELDRYVTSEGL